MNYENKRLNDLAKNILIGMELVDKRVDTLGGKKVKKELNEEEQRQAIKETNDFFSNKRMQRKLEELKDLIVDNTYREQLQNLYKGAKATSDSQINSMNMEVKFNPYNLKEDVSSDEVLDAIRGKYHVRINYDDGMEDNGGNPKGSRVIQPMALGTTKKGHPVVRAFQVSGNSRRGAPKWKFFRLDRVTSWRPMRNKRFFNTPDDSYGEYNKTGDRTMQTFVDNAKFGDMNDPLERARAERQSIANSPKVSTKNAQGPISANQQWKKNVFTSQPNSNKYAQFARNVEKTSEKDTNYWDEYEKALQQANMQNQAPKPQHSDSGPIDNGYDENFYDVNDVDFNENNFIKNKNRR